MSLRLEREKRRGTRENFDVFLNKYFNEHAFKTITTEDFLKYLNDNLIKDNTTLKNNININAWVYGPGIPANCPRAGMERFERVDNMRSEFLKGTLPPAAITQKWTTYEWLHFLRKMPKPLSLEQMKKLDDAYHFTKSTNSEIADLWFITAVTAGYEPAYGAMQEFLSTVGRRKFLEPLYKEMMQTGKQEMAKRIYNAYRENYHPLAQESLDKIVK